ncbi:hypothetical protein Syun_026970 [Stephania yunnanensis]|uniref:RRM domain-containing protein n=1 Tax=Stephania yunnanensis TaxID=152371 RepID=A0AAP0EF20_9MAGN
MDGMRDLNEDEVPASVEGLDRNVEVYKDLVEVISQENDELGDGKNGEDVRLMERNGHSRHKLSYVGDNDEEKQNEVDDNVESLCYDQREDELSSSPVQKISCSDELGNKEPDFPMEVSEALDTRYQLKNMGNENYVCNEGLKGNAETKIEESFLFENSEASFDGMGGADGEQVNDGYEAKKEDVYSSDILALDNGKLESSNVDQCSAGRTLEGSMSPVKRRSYPEKSPDERSTGVQDPSYSPRSYEAKRSPSPERHDDDGEKVIPQDHLSNSVRQSSTSPRRRSSRDLHGDEPLQKHLPISPPRRHHKSPDYRRRDRSVSRSPARRNGSASQRRSHYHDRSRSRSPRGRDHYRRSPRRYSPRRRSPPSSHYSRRRSPRRRPWSPPPNRNNGIGMPGNNLFVAGFSFMTTERDLERKFSRFGRVRDVRIVRDKRSGDSRGFGFLSLDRDEDADAAIRSLDQTEWNGRIVLVEKSKSH